MWSLVSYICRVSLVFLGLLKELINGVLARDGDHLDSLHLSWKLSIWSSLLVYCHNGLSLGLLGGAWLC